MIDLNAIQKLSVSEEVRKFMVKYSTNHNSLSEGWKEVPKMVESANCLEQQLTYALDRRKGREVIRRIMSRLRARHKEAEELYVDALYGRLDGQDGWGVLS